MIKLNHPAYAHCDMPGCSAAQPVTLVLTASGGFHVVPQSATWQIDVAPNGVVVTRCPEHAISRPLVRQAAAPSLPPESMT